MAGRLVVRLLDAEVGHPTIVGIEWTIITSIEFSPSM
jgi:hypothetical protein